MITKRITLVSANEDTIIEEIKPLIDKGEDINLADADGYTPLMWAVKREFSKLAKFLIDQGCKIEGTCIFTSIANNDFETFEVLVNAGINIKSKDALGWTPIFHASLKGNTEMLDLLIKKGAKVSSKTREGTNLLMVAGSCEVAKRLIDLGLKVNDVDKLGITALINQASNGSSPDIINFLIDKGADIDSKDKWSQTALFKAVENDNNEIVETLLKRGANKLIADVDGMLPVDMAKENDNSELVELLLKE